MGTGYTRHVELKLTAELAVTGDYARDNSLSVRDIEQLVEAAVRLALSGCNGDVRVRDLNIESKET